MDLLRQLTNTRLLDAASVEQHLAAMSDIRTQFVNYGKAIPEWIAALLLLLSVPTDDPHWEVFLASHTAAATVTAAAPSDQDKSPGITWDGVSAAIMAEASKQSQQQAERARKQQLDSAAVAAYAARTQGNKQRSTDKDDNKQPRYCTHCDKTGHVVEQCFKLHPELRRERTNHAKFVTVNDKSTALACHSNLTSITEPSAGLWYVDSGASCCLTGDKTWFTELHSCVPCTVTAANNGVLTCSQRGTVVLNVQHGSITVRDVLYVPTMPVNLLSVSALIKAGYQPRFTPTRCSILKRSTLLAHAKMHDSVYPLVASRPSAKVLSAVVSSASKGLDWATVHARLGHLNPQAIQLLHDKRMAHGIDMPTQGSPDDVKQCVGCAIGKALRLPFPAQASSRATRPLQLVHSDICGPIEVVHELVNNKQLVNKWYILTFVDDYSRWLWIAIITDKSGKTVMSQFIKFKVWAERYTGFDITALRTDGGGEYVNDDFQTYLQTMGIERNITTAYTPQQNGVAERVNRTIMEAARAMLHAANLPSSFWTYAVNAAVYIRNRSPTRALNNVTPYEAWRGEKPSLSHLRVFGCRAYMYLHKKQRSSTNKLAARAMPGIFVGYATEAKAWLVWDPVAKKVHTTRDVKFMEGESGSAPVPPTQPPVKAAEPTSNSTDNDSESAEAAEPMDTERSTIIDPLIIADDESDSDSEDVAEPVAPAEPAVAVEPAAAPVQQPADQPVSSPPSATYAGAVGASHARRARLHQSQQHIHAGPTTSWQTDHWL